MHSTTRHCSQYSTRYCRSLPLATMVLFFACMACSAWAQLSYEGRIAAYAKNAAQDAAAERARTQAEKDLVAYASQAPRYRFQGFIEQGTQRFALTNGATLHLKAAPFQWVLQFKPGESEGVVMGAAWQRAWVDEVRRSDVRNPLFRIYSSMATAEPPDPESYELFVGRPCASRAPTGDPQDICPGTHVALQIDASVRKDFHTMRPGSYEYVREVRSIRDVSGDTPSPPKPLQDFAGKTLYMVMAETIDAGGKIVDGLNMHDGLRLVNPRYITLVFSR